MSAPSRRRRVIRPDERVLEPEVWEQPRSLSADEGRRIAGADRRFARPLFNEVSNDD